MIPGHLSTKDTNVTTEECSDRCGETISSLVGAGDTRPSQSHQVCTEWDVVGYIYTLLRSGHLLSKGHFQELIYNCYY